MEGPIDNLTTQSTGEDEAQKDKPSAIPKGAASKFGSNVESQNATTDNTETTSMPQADDGSHDEGSKSESLVYTVPRTPVLDLARLGSPRQIHVIRLSIGEDNFGKMHYGSEIEHNGRRHCVPRLPLALQSSLILPTQTGQSFVINSAITCIGATTSSKQFVKIASRVPGPPYEDGLVVSGRTYFYVVTALDQAGRESRFSGEVRATIP